MPKGPCRPGADLRPGGPPLAGRHPIIEAGGSGWWGIPLLHTNQDGSVLAVGDRRGWWPTRGAVATRVPPKRAVDRAVRKVDLNRVSPGRAGGTVGDRTIAHRPYHTVEGLSQGEGSGRRCWRSCGRWWRSSGKGRRVGHRLGVTGGKLRSGAIELVKCVPYRTGKDRIASSYSAESSR